MTKNITLKVGKYKFGVANLEVYERMSEETIAFSADITINGVAVGHCSNSGKGEGNYPFIAKEYWDKYDAIEKEVSNYVYKTQYMGKPMQWNYTMDFLISNMVYEAWYENKKTYKFDGE